MPPIGVPKGQSGQSGGGGNSSNEIPSGGEGASLCQVNKNYPGQTTSSNSSVPRMQVDRILRSWVSDESEKDET